MRSYGIEVETTIHPRDSRFDEKWLKKITVPKNYSGYPDIRLLEGQFTLSSGMVDYSWEKDVFDNFEIVTRPVFDLLSFYELVKVATEKAKSVAFSSGYVDENTAICKINKIDISCSVKPVELGLSVSNLPAPLESVPESWYDSWFLSQIALSNIPLVKFMTDSHYPQLRRVKETNQYLLHSSIEFPNKSAKLKDMQMETRHLALALTNILDLN